VSMKLSSGRSSMSRGAKTACSINSNNSSIEFDCSLQKTATGNGNLQPEIEINEYTRVVKNYLSSLLLE